MDAVQQVYDMFIGQLRAGTPPVEAEATLRRLIPDQEVISAAIERYEAIVGNVITAREPDAFRDPRRLTPWYTGPRPADPHWPALRGALEADRFPAEGLQSLDLASTKVVANLPPPWKGEFSGRGLVLGYVQSGKTSNFTAVVAKAADAGYRLFVVLSGIHNNLRRQTQMRLDEQLIAPNRSSWVQLTNELADFGNPGNADALLSQNQLRVLAIVKKNKSRLENLIAWLGSASAMARRNCPILVIDDEADQASVNARDLENRTVINGLILKLLAQPRVAYVGYTATPFANIFIDPSIPEDLYPRDFIVDLPKPAGYFGPERLFGREALTGEEAAVDGLDMIRLVPDDEITELRPPRKKSDRAGWDPGLTPSLATAIQYFLLATAARRARGGAGKHSSMLVHTTQLTDVHERYRGPIEAEIASLRSQVASGAISELQLLWESEMGLVPAAEVGEAPVGFADLRPSLDSVLDGVEVVVDNSRSDNRLHYGDEAQVVIAIGGNTLSRGLTLEGLVTSFFLRTASAYDTLLQMGRWFGYRRGYADLPRIWLTGELAEWFQFLATVEAEIRTDVSRYEKEDLTPEEFAVRVRTHPQLAITSALKMQAAERASVSYSGRRLQTILFEHRDHRWLAANIAAAKGLISSAGPEQAEALGRGRFLMRDVPVGAIDRFLAAYAFHPDSQDLVAERIREYIGGQNAHGDLHRWNVGIVSRQDKRWGTIDLGLPTELGLINRAAMRAVSKPHANIKSLMSKEDRVLDLDVPRDVLVSSDDAELQQMRPNGTGLLILYPIDRHSRPVGSQKTRVDLDAVDDVIAVGLVFPDAATRDTEVSYVAVALPLGDIEEPEAEDAEAIDTEASLDEVSV